MKEALNTNANTANTANTANATASAPATATTTPIEITVSHHPRSPEEERDAVRARKGQERVEFVKDLGSTFLIMAGGVFGLTVASAAAVKVGRSVFGVDLAPPPVKQ